MTKHNCYLNDTYSFAKLACNASLFSRGVSPQSVLASESGGNWTLCNNQHSIFLVATIPHMNLLKWIENSVSRRYQHNPQQTEDSMANSRRPEVLFQHHIHPAEHLQQEEVFPSLVQYTLLSFIPSLWFGQPEACWRGSRGCGVCSKTDR
jgi:hypothetical protein